MASQIIPWVFQIVQDLEKRVKAYTRALIDERARVMDARVDAIEDLVQKRFTNTRPADMSVV